MWPIVVGVLRRYVPYITFPFVCIIGTIGYHIEDSISDKYTPAAPSIQQQRSERLLAKLDSESKPEKHNPLKFNFYQK